ncbi:phage holin, lambda family [Morganella morganii]|uniref:phage holin, lambda family n=1 Tax=Morganella morganii TaxID=582 RepID=UPI0015E67E4D|nr:phage holin, lambda family [Morganella morganii]QXO44524.1 phage holin, lambda family [Morganella morganii]QXO48080.1 phage holin, lambda family [Morganella morganii]QXO51939.1 phage holin, lambda family [Morganella morganii]QXO55793.1 phage holin, lambda family [Morganella morganii]QXO55869.1 phage holin, lambda family [Morganella morganii]
MKENPDVWDQVWMYLSQYKDQGIFAALAGSVAILRGRYNGGGWKKTIFDGLMCAIFAWFVKDLLALLGLNPDLAYLTSVFIGYIGVDALSKIIKGKAGVSDD